MSLFGKGILRLIPIFAGIIVGYIASIFFGIVDFQPVLDAKWFTLPAFVRPEICWEAIIFMIPVAIAPVILKLLVLSLSQKLLTLRLYV